MRMTADFGTEHRREKDSGIVSYNNEEKVVTQNLLLRKSLSKHK